MRKANNYKVLLYLCVFSTCMLLTTGCEKQNDLPPISGINPTSSIPIKISFDRTTAFVGCVTAKGICINEFSSRIDWLNYELQPNEAKGEAWVVQESAIEVTIYYQLSEVILTPQLINKIVTDRQLFFEEDTYIPSELLTKLYNNTDVKNKPTELKIAKGGYTVTVNNLPATPTIRDPKKITIKIGIGYGGGGWKPSLGIAFNF